MRKYLHPRVAILLGGLALSACTSTETSSIAVTLGDQTLELSQGASNTVSIQVARSNYDDEVTLSASGLPAGVTAAFTPGTLASDVTTSSLTLTATGAAAVGDASVTITASGDDVASSSATLTLSVTEAGSFTLSATPATLNVTRGGTATTTVSIARMPGFTGNVTLSATGLPSGVTASFSPAATTGTSSTLTLTANGSATLGAATVAITGASTGVGNQSTNLALTVVAAGSTTLMTIDFCAEDAPTWAAYQNEGGAWTQMIPDANHTISAQITPKVALALAFGPGDIQVVYTTAAELAPQNGVTCVEDPTSSKTLNGSVANATTHGVSITMGFDGAFIFAPDNTFSISPPDGAVDLVASRNDEDNFEWEPDKVIIRRALNLANNATIPVLDFNAAEAVATVSNTLTVTGAGSDDLYAYNSFIASSHTPNMTFHQIWSASGITGSAPFLSVPATSTVTGDLHMLTVDAYDATSGDWERGAMAFFRTPANKTIALAPALAAPTVTTVAATPYVRPRLQLAAGEYTGALAVSFYDPSSGNDFGIYITRNYLGSAPTTWDVTVPDLSGVTGWNNAWGLQSATGLEVYVDAYSEPFGLFSDIGADNTIVKTAFWTNSAFSVRRPDAAGGEARATHAPRKLPRVTWHGVER